MRTVKSVILAEPEKPTGTPRLHLTSGSDVLAEMTRLLDHPPALTAKSLKDETRLTRRWVHGEVHGNLPALKGHVIMAHYGREHEASLKLGTKRLTSRTRPGTIVVIPEGHEGRWDIAGSVEVSHVYLTNERLQSAADLLTGGKPAELVDRVCFDDPVVARILGILSDEATVTDISARLFLDQAVDLLCTQLVRTHSTLNALEVPAPRKGLADWQVKRVTAHMHERLSEQIGLDELAGLVNLSRFHFCTAFRIATGRTPHEWLTHQRIARARELLADPLLPITEIALSVGYETPSSFAASFRRVAGMTPTAYRRRA